MKFYDTIDTQLQMGVVTAAHFAPFQNCRNWLLLDNGDVPGDHNGGGVYEFSVVTVSARRNIVKIAVFYKPYPGIDHQTTLHMWFNADELAIRMEAA